MYVAAPEGHTGKSVIALGVLDTVLREVESVGVFRPLVRAGERDGILEMMLAQPGIDQTYDEAVGLITAEAVTDPERALTQIIEQYGADTMRTYIMFIGGYRVYFIKFIHVIMVINKNYITPAKQPSFGCCRRCRYLVAVHPMRIR